MNPYLDVISGQSTMCRAAFKDDPYLSHPNYDLYMKTLFSFLLATIITGVSFSQVQFGLKGGINLATVRALNEDNSKARLGYYIGGLGEIGHYDLFIRPELIYSSKGFGYSAREF